MSHAAAPILIPVVWVAITLGAWLGAQALHRRSGGALATNPVAVSIAVLVAVLLVTETGYPVYAAATAPITFLIGPAMIALAMPLLANMHLIRRTWRPIVAALLGGSLTALGSGWVFGRLFSVSPTLLLSLLPRSVTAPVAMALGERIGGSAVLTMTAVLVTDVVGSMLLPLSVRTAPDDDDHRALGFAAGLGAHAFGTARAIGFGEAAGAFAVIGMLLNAVATAIWLLAIR